MDNIYLLPTAIIDSDHERIIEFAKDRVEECNDPVERAVKLYYAVRDGIWYDPYTPFYLPDHYRASNVLKSGRGFCVPKASLLCALGRACGIPARVGFASVKNHLTTRQLLEMMGTDLFVFHGYTEFYLERKWVKATPAFNIDLCKRHRVSPLDFDGRHDSLLQPFDLEKRQFMEYVADHGVFADIPVDLIVAAWKEAYGEERVRSWIARFEEAGGKSRAEFEKEDVWKGS
jgi:transglutaminase-like putative cysteine protease